MVSADMRWRIEMFGGLCVRQGERTVHRFRAQKPGALLAYLAYYLRRPHPREVLVELLWPEGSPRAGRNSLNTALSSLRRQLEPPGVAAGTVLIADYFSVQLNPAAITTDVAEFEAALRAANHATSHQEQLQHLMRAIDLYQGELLTGYYEEWALQEQRRLADLYFGAAHDLLARLEQRGDYHRAIDYAHRMLRLDALHEEIHQDLMRLYAAAGRPQEALRQFAQLERMLAEQLDRTPSMAARRLAAHIETSALQVEDSREAVDNFGLRKEALTSTSTRAALPAGTLTFVLTDIEGSTRLWEQVGDAFRLALADHHRLLRAEFARFHGLEAKEMGDGFLVAFARAQDALAGAIAGQRALAAHSWPESTGRLKVRMALHTGDVELEEGEYHGLALHRASRILTAGHGGQILCSEATTALLRRDLPAEVRLADLGLYRLRDVPAPERLFQVEYPGMPARDFAPLNAEAGYTSRLPAPLTQFWGREEPLSRLQALLTADYPRLVTLVGPGGTGKTRLSIEAAGRAIESFGGAVWFVPLADLTDGRLLAHAILKALQLSHSPDHDPQDQIVETLSRQLSLLVLDNLEQIAAEAAPIAHELLARAPTLKCLATSRQPLGVPGEQEFIVPPLQTPNGADTPERLMQCESVRLFVDRAQAVKPDFQVTDRNASAVAELCDRLEGIPLAIELAAARAQLLTPAQMLAQMENRFDFLASRRRVAEERHRTLRAAIDWSYRLLDPASQRFFSSLSVFRGGWTLAAAEGVGYRVSGMGEKTEGEKGRRGEGEENREQGIGNREQTIQNPTPDTRHPSVANTRSPVLPDTRHPTPDTLDFLSQLREHSLLLAEAEGEETRFRMLDMLREYAAEQLSEPERARVSRRHADYYLTLAEEAGPELRGVRQVTWLDRLAREQDNLLAALEWACRNGENRLCARLSLALYPLLYHQGSWTEARNCLQMGLEASRSLGDDGRPIRARILCELAGLNFDKGERVEARRQVEESLALRRELDDAAGMAEAQNLMGLLALYADEPDTAQRHFEAALTLRANPHGRGIALHNLARLAGRRGDLGEARRLYEMALLHRRAAGDVRGEAETLGNLGAIAYRLHAPPAPQVWGEKPAPPAPEIWREKFVPPTPEVGGQAEYGDARRLYLESLRLYRSIHYPLGVAMMLNNLGELAEQQNDTETAMLLFLHAERLLRELGSHHAAAPAEALQRLANQVGADRLERARQSAAQTPWEQITDSLAEAF